MNKIALISVHNDPNYGSALQAYALAYLIKREGRDCEYINYTPIANQSGLKHWIKVTAKIILKFIGIIKDNPSEYSYWHTPKFVEYRKVFTAFHDRFIPFSEKLYNPNSISKANNSYERFIVGSDQTWSPYVTKAKNNINFLRFVEKGKIRGSYAPSLGSCHLSDEYMNLLKEYISGFDFLSCREHHNAQVLTERLGKIVHYVLDPTLLVSRDEWLNIAETIEMPGKYILCYILGTKKCISDYAENLGKTKKLPVYYIVSRPEYQNNIYSLHNVTPGQFVTLVSKASYIITDSFHGSLFSINFNRQFYAFTKRSMLEGSIDNDRVGDFLEVLDLSERLMKDDGNAVLSDIDYKIINDKIGNLRQQSLTYLKQLIS